MFGKDRRDYGTKYKAIIKKERLRKHEIKNTHNTPEVQDLITDYLNRIKEIMESIN